MSVACVCVSTSVYMCDDGWVSGINVTCLEGVSDELKPSDEIKPCSSSSALRMLTHEHTSLSLSVCPPLSPFLWICLVCPFDWVCVTGLLLLKAPLRSSSASQWPQRSPRPLSLCAEWHMTSLRGPWTLTGPFKALGLMLSLTWAPDQHLNGRKSLKDIKTSHLSLLEGWWVSKTMMENVSEDWLILSQGSRVLESDWSIAVFKCLFIILNIIYGSMTKNPANSN